MPPDAFEMALEAALDEARRAVLAAHQGAQGRRHQADAVKTPKKFITVSSCHSELYLNQEPGEVPERLITEVARKPKKKLTITPNRSELYLEHGDSPEPVVRRPRAEAVGEAPARSPQRLVTVSSSRSEPRLEDLKGLSPMMEQPSSPVEAPAPLNHPWAGPKWPSTRSASGPAEPAPEPGGLVQPPAEEVPPESPSASRLYVPGEESPPALPQSSRLVPLLQPVGPSAVAPQPFAPPAAAPEGALAPLPPDPEPPAAPEQRPLWLGGESLVEQPTGAAVWAPEEPPAQNKYVSDSGKNSRGRSPSDQLFHSGTLSMMAPQETVKHRRLSAMLSTVSAPSLAQTHTTEGMVSAWRRCVEWKLSKANPVLALDLVMSVFIVLNAIVVGMSVDVAPDWPGWVFINALFVTVFVAEMVLKFRAYGVRVYFRGRRWMWNLAEFCLVISSVVDLAMEVLSRLSRSNLQVVFTLMRMLRLMRIGRILRVARLPIFAELLLMVNGCVAGLKTLLWSQLLLAVPLYMGALVARQALGNYPLDPEVPDLNGNKGFQTVTSSFFTMYRCFLGGECYTENGVPIFLQVIRAYGNGWGLFYYFMSAFMSFGMANVIVAIFVESTVASAKFNELRQKQSRLTDRRRFAEKMYKLVEMIWENHEENINGCSLQELTTDQLAELVITPALFHQLREDAAFKQVLGELDIAYEEQADLFDTLDVDGSGTLDLEELVSGIEKMRGDARRSDVVGVSLRLKALSDDVGDSHKKFQDYLHFLSERLLALEGTLSEMVPSPGSPAMLTGSSP